MTSRTFRFKITLWYSAIMAAVLMVFGFLLHQRVQQDLLMETDHLLAVEADAAADKIFAFWRGEQQAEVKVKSARVPPEAEEVLTREDFETLVRAWADSTHELRSGTPIQILNRSGVPIVSSPLFEKWNITSKEIGISKSPPQNDRYATFYMGENAVRIVMRPIKTRNGSILYYVRAAKQLDQPYRLLQSLRTWLLVLIPSVLLASSLVGWLLVSSALKPVKQMTREASSITHEHLDRRIHYPESHDEIEQLGATFNQMLDRLEASFRRIRQFSAAASHELRTPLTAMKGELELVLRKPRAREEYLQVVETQLEIVNDLIFTVEQLLFISRSGADTALESEVFDLAEILEDARDVLLSRASEKNVSMRLESFKAVHVQGEKNLIRSLVLNLIENAVKHSPQGAPVVISAKRHEGFAQLLVQDSGPGISEADRPKLFDKFFSQRKSGQDAHSTGLGLGLCRWIVEAHKGRIEVSSIPGSGATFSVYLPLAK